MSTLYSTPLPAHQQSQSILRSRPRKRKRKSGHGERTESDDLNSRSTTPQAQTSVGSSPLDEYTAIITPDERAQRRLASYSLIDELPPPPFPHAPLKEGVEKKRKPYGRRGEAATSDCDSNSRSSLRSQHLAAMTAVLHKCLQKKDYIRASRALGLILRTDVNGKAVDIRASGNWSTGAEILLRRDSQHRHRQNVEDGHLPNKSQANALPFTRRGFEDAKALYENLIIQHPYHKSAPDSINAIDFYLAMFSLWIYVAQAEATRQQHEFDDDRLDDNSVDDLARLRDMKLAHLAQADSIAARIDSCMSSGPFSDHNDLCRMRAMLALWQADLNDACQEFTRMDTEPDDAGSPDAVMHAVQGLQIHDDSVLSSKQLRSAAQDARKIAQRMFERAGTGRDPED